MRVGVEDAAARDQLQRAVGTRSVDQLVGKVRLQVRRPITLKRTVLPLANWTATWSPGRSCDSR